MSKKYLTTFILLILSFHSFSQQYGTLNDSRDNRVYKTVKIGGQEWMAENYNGTKFRNGDIIPQAKTLAEWSKATLEKKAVWCYNFSSDMENNKLYSMWAILDPRGLAPKGWHIPTREEIQTLMEYYPTFIPLEPKKDTSSENGNYSDEPTFTIKGEVEIKPGQKFRAIGWGGGTNESGFNAKQYSCMNSNGKTRFPGTDWWLQKRPNGNFVYFSMRASSGNFIIGTFSTQESRDALSIRFIKD